MINSSSLIYIPHPNINCHNISFLACHINTTAIGACSMTSAAEGGTIFVLYPTAAAISSNNVRRLSNLFKKKKKKNPPNNKRLFAGFASIGIMASDLNTKVSVTCPHISAGTTVSTVGH